jgi:hypothetical protein
MCPLYGKERTAYDKTVMQWVAIKKDVPLGAMYSSDRSELRDPLKSWRRSIE